MTPAELAAKVCVTRQTNNAIEQNKYAPSLDTAFRTAEALGVPIGDAFSCR
ncbi:MAG TPA: helix-turn-helix domain-containing protein [Rhizomicrobium sp.]|nr:helix-turn-helix domain-containing protein [Rhizomicrobium sp.]